jgi:hypothetical protein
MIDATAIAILNRHIRRTGRSLLQYAGESYPWVKDSSGLEMLRKLQAMIQEEQQDTAALIKFLVKQHVTPPYLGSYPIHFTNFNFLAVDRMLALLTEHEEQDVEELEKDLRNIKAPDVRRLLEPMLNHKEHHLDNMREMRVQATSPASVT